MHFNFFSTHRTLVKTAVVVSVLAAAVFLAGVLTVSTPARAATGDPCFVNTPNPNTGGVDRTQGTITDQGECSVNGLVVKNNSQSTITNANNKQIGSTDAGFCNSASTCISSVVYVFTVGLMSIFAYIGSYVFDFAVQVALNSTSYALSFLTSGWTVVRDIANMAFVFILIYIAFTIIFEAETHGTMKTLAAVVIMALLINFSFFLTRVVIDAGNILSIQFYNAIPAPTLAEQAKQNGLLSPAGITASASYFNGNIKDLTSGIMGAIQVQNLLNSESFKNYMADQGSGVSVFLTNLITEVLIYIAVAAILAMLGFAFLAVGFKFLMRVVVLWFIIISAPLAFAMRALTNNRKAVGLYQQWQDTLIQFSFYPAIFLFMFLIMTNIMVAIGGSEGVVPSVFTDLTGTGLTGVGALAAGIANVSIRLGFILIMLYFGLRVADMVAKTGSGMAKGFAERVTGYVGSRTAGGAAALGRTTVGWAGYQIGRSAAVRDAASRTGLVGLFGSGIQKAATKTSKATFDVRNAPGGSLIQKRLGIDIGKGGKGGYVEHSDAAAHKKEAFGKSLEPTGREKAEAKAQAEKEFAETKAQTQKKYEEEKQNWSRASEFAKANLDGWRRVMQKNREKAQALIKEGKHDEARELTERTNAEEKERRENLDYVNKHVSTIEKEHGEHMKELQKNVTDRAKSLSGEGASKEYAQTLITPSLRNAGMIFRSSKEAAEHLHHTKGTKDQLEEVVKKLIKENGEGGGDHEPEGGGHSPKGGGGGGHAPSGGGDHGGDAHGGSNAGGAHGGGAHAFNSSEVTATIDKEAMNQLANRIGNRITSALKENQNAVMGELHSLRDTTQEPPKPKNDNNPGQQPPKAA